MMVYARGHQYLLFAQREVPVLGGILTRLFCPCGHWTTVMSDRTPTVPELRDILQEKVPRCDWTDAPATISETPTTRVTDHASWPEVAPFVVAQRYDRDGGHENPRWRLELGSDAPAAIVDTALGMQVGCASCGKPIHCFRERAGSGGVYLAVACPLDVNMACARHRACADEYIHIRQALTSVKSAPRRQRSFDWAEGQ